MLHELITIKLYYTYLLSLLYMQTFVVSDIFVLCGN